MGFCFRFIGREELVVVLQTVQLIFHEVFPLQLPLKSLIIFYNSRACLKHKAGPGSQPGQEQAIPLLFHIRMFATSSRVPLHGWQCDPSHQCVHLPHHHCHKQCVPRQCAA